MSIINKNYTVKKNCPQLKKRILKHALNYYNIEIILHIYYAFLFKHYY